ncbi:hypothetical protein CU097_003298, partial [Rhizopus azygosporus]
LTFCINSTNDVQNEPGQDEEELSPEIDLPSDNTMSIISPNIKPCAVVSHSVPSTGVADSLSGDDADNAVLYACQQMDFRQHLTNEILFGFVRIEDKFILITYVPDSVSGVRRARALVHSRSVASVCELSHAQITASSLSDLSDSNIRTRLKLGENQVPNRPRPAKRSSVVSTTTRRRKSAQSIPSPSPTPPPILPVSDKRTPLIINTSTTTEEPESYATPSTPTSVASFSDTTTNKKNEERNKTNVLKKKEKRLTWSFN